MVGRDNVYYTHLGQWLATIGSCRVLRLPIEADPSFRLVRKFFCWPSLRKWSMQPRSRLEAFDSSNNIFSTQSRLFN